MKKIAVIIPIYNESQNVKILLDRLFEVLPDAYVVAVDDSVDSEHQKIKTIIKFYTQPITLVRRYKKEGRGSAVIEGFKKALLNKEIYYFFEMDSDLVHNPQDMPLFLKNIQEKNVDLISGSRYLKKSKIVNWPFKRLLLSKIINYALNKWLGLNLTDYTNGFRLYKRPTIEKLLSFSLKEKGFIALSESAFLLKKEGFVIKEIPITFTDRKFGKSSVGTIETISCLFGAIRIKIDYLLKGITKL